MTCTFPDCDRPVQAAGYCSAHYKQKSRGEQLRPMRTARGEGASLSLRMPIALLQATQLAAKDDGLELAEWWRLAAESQLRKK
jgi:hypothetical protein